MVQAIKNKIESINLREKQIFWSLFSVFFVLLFTYGYLVNSTILNAVSKQKMQSEMVLLNSNLNTLEFQYLNLKNKITMDYATSLGFVAISYDKFASISSSDSKSLSINEN
jgi:hypothetical protein